MVLERGEKRQAVSLRHDLHVVELVAVHRGGSDGADLSGLDQLVKRRHRLFDRSRVVKSVDLVQVQVIRPEPSERSLYLPCNRILGEMSVVEVDLGGENDLVARNAKRLQGGAKVFLARAMRVAVGGVEEVDAEIERVRDHLRRLFQGERPRLEVVGRLAV